MTRHFQYAMPAVLALLAGPALAADPASMDETGRMNYALGYQIGRDVAGIELRSDALLEGLKDARGGKPKLDDAQMEAALTALQAKVTEQRAKTQAAAAQKASTAGSAYLAENAKKPGVQTTATGLQYKVVKQGAGKTPTATDTVTVHYRGTLVDGTEFDSSYKRGQPATFPVGGVIPGWTEALQLMKVGSTYQLAIPANLAYGDRGPLAGQVLLFDVELLGTGAGTGETGK